MLTVLSLVTSVKDYIEIAHKLIESQNGNFLISNPNLNPGQQNPGFFLTDYTELGAILTYIVLSIKEFLTSFLSFAWVNKLWSLPLIVPDIASAMISEVSVLDSYFTNAFSFLETGLSLSANNLGTNPGSENSFLYGLEKFLTGFLNSFFLFLPTSTAHLITLRRFVVQGLEAGYMAGLGTIAGNFLWLTSIILGWRFLVIPWISFDIFRYLLGFSLLVKYLWDSSKELNQTNPKIAEDDWNAKKKIFALNFLLALTEQTSIYPFISNLSFGPEGSILESFSGTIFQSYAPDAHSLQFIAIHGCYLLGILLGSLSLLYFTVWFWENPAFSIYMWMISSYRVTTSSYYKVLNFVFLYLTMLCAISSIPYFGLDYTITNPLGLIPQDRMIDQKFTTANGPGDKILQETAFLGVKPTDKNTRIRDGVHARRERWKERLIKYQAFDASLYDQGTYDILTIEDLNYGFDRFWLRRKLRNHQIRFRLFPGPWMRSLKKQLNKPGFSGPRVEFFRILFEQYYHPIFHSRAGGQKEAISKKQITSSSTKADIKKEYGINTTKLSVYETQRLEAANQTGLYTQNAGQLNLKKGLILNNLDSKNVTTTVGTEVSALRKFSRNFTNRINTAIITEPKRFAQLSILTLDTTANSAENKIIYSKSLKSLYTKINKDYSKEKQNLFRNISRNLLSTPPLSKNLTANGNQFNWSKELKTNKESMLGKSLSTLKRTNIRKKVSKQERLLLTYKSAGVTSTFDAALANNPNQINAVKAQLDGSSLLKPLNFYLQKDEALKRKFKYYSTTVRRNLSVGNNAPYLKTMLKRAFYYHKPSLRWKRTMFTAAMRRGFRKKSNTPKKLIYTTNNLTTPSLTLMPQNSQTLNGTSPNYAPDTIQLATTNSTTIGNSNVEVNLISPKTSSYSVLGKRASRYRYQIYKDVLQHWYYSPFNRLLLKFDIDSFINRQPKAHFLTKKEERLLHLRRVLLAEHYNSLRWYTYMQHYRTMKSQIGSTKSLASTVYNQQFQGTFKKIRHLFAITPAQGDMPVLQFDQPLYNSKNLSATVGLEQTTKNLNLPTYTHEENAVDTQTVTQTKLPNLLAAPQVQQDFIDQSLNVTGEYLKVQNKETTALIQKYVQEKNYAELAILLSSDGLQKNSPEGGLNKTLNITDSNNTNLLLVRLLKECKNRLNDPTFFKNYISHRIEKREQRNNDTQKELKQQLGALENWLSPILLDANNATKEKVNLNALDTTSTRKALNEGVFTLNNINPANSSKTLNIKAIQNLKFQKDNIRPFTKVTNQNTNSISTVYLLQKEENIQQTLKTLNYLYSNKQTNSKTNNTISNLAKTSNTKVNKAVTSLIKESKKSIHTLLTPVLWVQNNIFMKRTEKNLEWWRQKQRVTTKIQKSRKKFKRMAEVIKETAEIKTLPATNTTYIQGLGTLRKKVDSQENTNNIGNSTLEKQSQNTQTVASNGENKLTRNIFRNFVFQKFKAKNSSKGRRFRNISRNRDFAYVRRPKLSTSLYSDVLKEQYNASMPQSELLSAELLSKEEKSNLFKTLKRSNVLKNTLIQKLTAEQNTNSNISNLKNLLVKTSIKKSPIQKRTKRKWSKLKRQKFTQDHNRYRKRRIHGLGKIRNLNKKLKRIQAIQELQNWWWNNYLPNYIARFELQTKTNIVPQKPTSGNSVGALPKYKPLSTREALDIRQQLYPSYAPYSTSTTSNTSKTIGNNFKVNLSTDATIMGNTNSLSQNNTENFKKKQFVFFKRPTLISGNTNPNTLDNSFDLYQNLLNNGISSSAFSGIINQNSQTQKDINNPNTISLTTNIPFYAGWDESLRKFVVTNRLLSRRDTGFRMYLDNSSIQKSDLPNTAKIEFTKAPIQGLNEGSFLYLQSEMPFNSYVIDQFIPSNQSFYAPLGWKRFQFRHSLLKNWFTNSKNVSMSNNTNTVGRFGSNNTQNETFKKENFYILDPSVMQKSNKSMLNFDQNQFKNRRIQKRFRLLRQTPTQLMYVPTGALLTDLLPSHYISVFDKQYRSPRNRYLKRFLPNIKSINNTSTVLSPSLTEKGKGMQLALSDYSNSLYKATQNNQNDSFNQTTYNYPVDYTLRKKIKPRRKYHKKRSIWSKKEGLIFPRRTKFLTNNLNNARGNEIDGSYGTSTNLEEDFRLRPSTKAKQTGIKKASISKKRAPKSMRSRQLRNREFKQVYKPLQRFEPRYGGFVWPGDYLRLEVFPMPKLNNLKVLTPSEDDTSKALTPQASTNKRAALPTKINIQPVGILPRKYLLEKHNLKVLKKKIALLDRPI